MGIFDRLSNGWKLGKMSLATIRDNPSLMLFPVISGAALTMIIISFLGGGYYFFGDEISRQVGSSDGNTGEILSYVGMFIFYLVNYFIVVFFNIGLVHCARMILDGRETSFTDGINFAGTRLSVIFQWAVLAATVGVVLKAIQEKSGSVGKIITGIVGAVWGIATFFVVPILAYEDVSPIEAVKRSGQIMKDKWGESLGSNFSFGIFSFLGIFFVAIPLGFLMGYFVHPGVGIGVGILAFLLVNVVVSAAKVVFLTATYQHVNNLPTGNFDGRVLDGAFARK